MSFQVAMPYSEEMATSPNESFESEEADDIQINEKKNPKNPKSPFVNPFQNIPDWLSGLSPNTKSSKCKY